MAKNIVFTDGNQLSETVPSGVKSGEPVIVGDRPGVALTDRDEAGKATIKFNGVAKLTVESAAGALAAGQIVYIDSDRKITRVSTDNKRFGYARAALATNVGGVIEVVIGY
ncbi:MAG: DUF2190 family protein [Candidatus Nanopelagicales bacterium]